MLDVARGTVFGSTSGYCRADTIGEGVVGVERRMLSASWVPISFNSDYMDFVTFVGRSCEE